MQVTVLSVLPMAADKQLPPTYHHVHMHLSDENDWSTYRTGMMNNETKTELAQFFRIPRIMKMLTQRLNEILRHAIVEELLRTDRQFDLFVMGYVFNEPLLGIAAHFRCPSVVITTTPALKSIRDLVGIPAEIATTSVFSNNGDLNVPPTFMQRCCLFIAYAVEYVINILVDNFLHKPVYAKYFPPTKGYPTYDEVKKNVSLVLVNHHFSQGDFRPMYPNIVDIGGIQIRAKPKPLPEVCLQLFYRSSVSSSPNISLIFHLVYRRIRSKC